MRSKDLSLVTKGIFLTAFVYAGLLSPAQAQTWPAGANGDLTINSGQVSQLIPGSVSDFHNLTINAGGVLEIDEARGWTVIGVSGDLILRGTIRSRTSVYISNLVALHSPDGFLLSGGTLVPVGGSAGGTIGFGSNARAGGNSAGGNGGGGAAWLSSGGDASTNAGGNGARGADLRSVSGRGGRGGAVPSGNGSPGGDDPAPNTVYNKHLGGGGGGGAHGKSGGLLYIRVLGKVDAVGGTFDVSGTTGGDGGNGGATNGPHQVETFYAPGGGGGGGAGGDGGTIVIMHDGVYLPGSYNVDGGQGGQGGHAGAPSAVQESDGQDGANGFPGVFAECPPTNKELCYGNNGHRF